ncbi:MAG TPA: hypothetical protein VJ144_05385 [Candidatus Polarisedimenticolia bacterium]|nr:hypothetical protein [Candidatus Polarisedimenticolia bacterium]
MSRIAASETARPGPAAAGNAQRADGWRRTFRASVIIPGLVLAAWVSAGGQAWAQG